MGGGREGGTIGTGASIECFFKRFERLEQSAAVKRLERFAVSAQRLERSGAIERLERFERLERAAILR